MVLCETPGSLQGGDRCYQNAWSTLLEIPPVDFLEEVAQSWELNWMDWQGLEEPQDGRREYMKHRKK